MPRFLWLAVLIVLGWMVGFWELERGGTQGDAASITLQWDASPSPEVTGYRLHYGTASGTYSVQTDVGNVLTATLTAAFVADTPYYFAATAYTAAAEESPYSNEVVHTFAAVTPSLVAAYSCDAGSGTQVEDVSGAANHGVLNGTWASGHTGQAIQFDGITQYVQIPHSASLALTATGTIEGWAFFTALNRWHGIIAKGTANSDQSHTYALEMTATNQLQCVLGNAVQAVVAQSAPQTILNTWVHVACTWDGSVLTLYTDGVALATAAQSLTPASNTAPLELGRFGGSVDYLQGKLDDIRMYTRALTAAEVQADMQTPVTGATVINATLLQLHFTP